jgi:hypothetical protein
MCLVGAGDEPDGTRPGPELPGPRLLGGDDSGMERKPQVAVRIHPNELLIRTGQAVTKSQTGTRRDNGGYHRLRTLVCAALQKRSDLGRQRCIESGVWHRYGFSRSLGVLIDAGS